MEFNNTSVQSFNTKQDLLDCLNIFPSDWINLPVLCIWVDKEEIEISSLKKQQNKIAIQNDFCDTRYSVLGLLPLFWVTSYVNSPLKYFHLFLV